MDLCAIILTAVNDSDVNASVTYDNVTDTLHFSCDEHYLFDDASSEATYSCSQCADLTLLLADVIRGQFGCKCKSIDICMDVIT